MAALADAVAILQIADQRIDELWVPEWQCSVYVRAITGVERDRYEMALMGDNELRFENATARLCTMALCDAQGKRIFNDGQVVDLGAKSAAALQRIYQAARRLAGIGKEALEEAEKKSAPLHGDSSSST